MTAVKQVNLRDDTPIKRLDDPLVTLLVPVFNEQDAIEVFLEAIAAELPELRLEVLFVNDGSRDETLAVLTSYARRDPRIKVLNLSRNFGKEAALTAGIDHASGDVVIPMDVDLQDPPEVIPQFIAAWRDGYDVVYGVRAQRTQDGLRKRTTANWFYALFNRLSPEKIPHNAGDFRLMDRRVVDAMKQLPERSRFMKGLFSWVGFPSTEVQYMRPERAAGVTKFNYTSLWRLALDGIFSFSSVPLTIWGYVGAVIASLSGLYAFWIVIKTLVLGVDVPGYASLMVVVLFFSGVQLLSLGVLGEYIARIFVEVKARPLYLLEGIYSAKGEDDPE